jgi:hypothetical protein
MTTRRSKPTPQVGDQVLGDPNERIVTDPDPNDEIHEDAPIDTIEVPEGATTILLVGGGRRVVPANQERAFRVYDMDGHAYDHCADAADGEWIYRPA